MYKNSISFLVLLIIITPNFAYAMDCPEPPQQIGTKIKGDIRSSANILLKYLGRAQFKGKAEVIQKDFYKKYPHASQLVVDMAFITAICSGLRDDPKLSESEKVNKLMEFKKQFTYRKNENPEKQSLLKWDKISVVSEYTRERIFKLRKNIEIKCANCLAYSHQVADEKLGGGPGDYALINAQACKKRIRLILSKGSCGTAFSNLPKFKGGQLESQYTPKNGREFADYIISPAEILKIDLNGICGVSVLPTSCIN